VIDDVTVNVSSWNFRPRKRVYRGDHERAAQAVALMTGQNTQLRSVPHARRNFTGEHSAKSSSLPGKCKHERRAGNELSAAGQQNNIFRKRSAPDLLRLLIVDVAIDVVGVSQMNQLGAGIKITVVPAGEP